MNYFHNETQTEVSFTTVQRRHPQVSLSRGADLIALGQGTYRRVREVTEVGAPEDLAFFNRTATFTNNEDGTVTKIVSFVAAPAEQVQAITDARANEVKAQRDRLLLETDWYVVRALETSTEVPAAVTTYRQALRDIPDQVGFPLAVIWPTLNIEA